VLRSRVIGRRRIEFESESEDDTYVERVRRKPEPKVIN
jgi:hypothetical protein